MCKGIRNLGLGLRVLVFNGQTYIYIIEPLLYRESKVQVAGGPQVAGDQLDDSKHGHPTLTVVSPYHYNHVINHGEQTLP